MNRKDEIILVWICGVSAFLLAGCILGADYSDWSILAIDSFPNNEVPLNFNCLDDRVEFSDNQTANKGIIIKYELFGGFYTLDPLDDRCHEYFIYDQAVNKLYFGGKDLTGKGVVNLTEADTNKLLNTVNKTNLKKFRDLSAEPPLDAGFREFVIYENGLYHLFSGGTFLTNYGPVHKGDLRPFNGEELKAFENVDLIVTNLKRLCDCVKDISE